MTPKTEHSRILLARNTAGTLAFCESCDVVEMEIGAISLRIDAESLEALSGLLKDAHFRLSYYRLEKANITQKQATDLSMH